MPRRSGSSPGEPTSRRKPATTPEDRETQMIELADRLAERQLLDGTASAQVITHFLKLGSSRERLEQEKLGLEQKLLEAKTEQIANQAKSEELFANAIKAMSSYQGRGEDSPVPDDRGFEE
jgi:hypothetical protein